MPQPEGPSRTRHSPGCTSRSMSRTAWCEPKRLLTFSKRTRTFVGASRGEPLYSRGPHMAMPFLALLLLRRLSRYRERGAFPLQQPAEVMATITAGCAGCSWAARGREAAILVLEVDGRYSQHLALRVERRTADYAVLLGPLAAGSPPAAGEARRSLEREGRGRRPHRVDLLPPFRRGRPRPRSPRPRPLRLRASRYAEALQRPAPPDLVRVGADGTWPAPPLLGRLHERRRGNARRPADGDMGTDDRRRVRLLGGAGRERPRARGAPPGEGSRARSPSRGRREGAPSRCSGWSPRTTCWATEARRGSASRPRRGPRISRIVRARR